MNGGACAREKKKVLYKQKPCNNVIALFDDDSANVDAICIRLKVNSDGVAQPAHTRNNGKRNDNGVVKVKFVCDLLLIMLFISIS